MTYQIDAGNGAALSCRLNEIVAVVLLAEFLNKALRDQRKVANGAELTGGIRRAFAASGNTARHGLLRLGGLYKFGCMNEKIWNELVADLNSDSIDECVKAASRLHKESDSSDVPRLLALLKDDGFFVREAAAWPLAELAGPTVLRELLVAYQRGFDEGHDNDGFSAALLEIPALHPATQPTLRTIIESSSEPMRGHAQWLLELCA